MTPRQFAALAAVAAASLIAAILVYSARSNWGIADAGGGKLMPSLEASASDVARIEVTQAGQTLAIAKSGESWQVASQGGYPASTEKVRALLLALSDAKLAEPKTRLPQRYTVLNVDDPASKTSSARLIRLSDANGHVLGEVIAGKDRATGTPATYVRRPGEEQSWLASTRIAGGTALKDWTTARVFETETEKVSLVTVEVAGEAPYEVRRVEGGAHELAAIPAGKKLKYVNLIDNIVEAASFVDFESVRKATGAVGGESGKVTLDADKGLKVTLKVRREKDAVWTTIEAQGEGDAKKTADEINARTAGWEFEILPSKADTMLKKNADLLEDAPS
jgi:hypothetical protein